MAFLSVAAILLLAQAAVGSQTPNDVAWRQRQQVAAAKRDAPVVQVGLFSYRPDGTVQGAAYDTGLTTESFQYVAGCAIGGGNRPVPDAATDAWRILGTIVRVSTDEAVVQLEWQRLRAAGVAVTSPGASVQLTLHPGDRVPLDSATIAATALCPARAVEFEARFSPRLFQWVPPPGVSEIGNPSGGGRVAVPATPGSGGSGGSAALGPVGNSPQNRATHAPKAIEESDPKAFNVDVWLVRSAPGKMDETVHQAVAAARGSASFSFAPVIVKTGSSATTIRITGMLRIVIDSSGVRQLVFTTLRTATFSTPPASGGDVLPSSHGASTTTNPMPGPDDVLAFELPPLPDGELTPDQFSIRVRMRPALFR